MARSRRGSFGLQPRVAPNVSAQIIALAREYVAKRDALIMDAWRNGGTFEGKKATDDMVLAYWRGRAKDLSKGDPEYESAKNNIMQLQYAIEQSKADVLHLQGKMSDNAYAQFFLRWANKVPKNSEFYRTLQKDAAQLIEGAKAKARADAERAKTENFNKFVKNTTDSDIAIGSAMTNALDAMSKKTGLSVTGNGDELLAMLTTDVKANPDSYRYLLDTIKKGDPGWDGNLTEGYFNQHIKSAVQGYSQIADRAQKGGYVSAYANATQGMDAMSSWGQNLRVWPVAESYSHAESSFLKVWNDPNASQMDKTQAAAAFSDRLTRLGKTPGIDAGAKSMLDADAARLLGQDAGDSPSFGPERLGRQGVDPAMTMQIGAWTQTAAEMAANPTAWSYAPVDANGQFDVTGQGPLGMVPAGSVQPGAQAVMVPGADGKAVMAMVMPHAVYSVDPNNPSANPKLAGYKLSYNVGGKTITMWGYKDSTEAKANHWSLVSPIAEDATAAVDSKGDVYVTPAAVDLTTQLAKVKDKDGNPIVLTDEQKKSLLDGGSITAITSDTSAKDTAGVKTTVTLAMKSGYFTSTTKTDQVDAKGTIVASTTDPTALTSFEGQAAFSPSRLAAGEVAGVTFNSPLAASVQAASYTQTQDQVSRYASDPAFQQAFLSQTMQSLQTDNPYDWRIAAAWNKVTTATAGAGIPDYRTPMSAAERADLRYPGELPKNDAAYGSKLSINFGASGELRLPNLPSYLGNQQINANMGPLGDAAKTIQGIMGNILPGLGAPPQQPQGSPAPNATPSGVNTTPGATPANLPAPTPTPAPTSVPASSSTSPTATQYQNWPGGAK